MMQNGCSPRYRRRPRSKHPRWRQWRNKWMTPSSMSKEVPRVVTSRPCKSPETRLIVRELMWNDTMLFLTQGKGFQRNFRLTQTWVTTKMTCARALSGSILGRPSGPLVIMPCFSSKPLIDFAIGFFLSRARYRTLVIKLGSCCKLLANTTPVRWRHLLNLFYILGWRILLHYPFTFLQ